MLPAFQPPRLQRGIVCFDTSINWGNSFESPPQYRYQTSPRGKRFSLVPEPLLVGRPLFYFPSSGVIASNARCRCALSLLCVRNGFIGIPRERELLRHRRPLRLKSVHRAAFLFPLLRFLRLDDAD